MRTVNEHRAAALALAAPLEAIELPLAEAAGHVLARDVCADGPLPPWDNSAMDGYAVRAADVSAAVPDGPVRLRVIADLAAGSAATPVVGPGEAARIMTGAPMPPGADAVVPVEQTDAATDVVAIGAPARVGAHVRRVGEDAAAGNVVLAAGALLAERRVGALAAAGAGTVTAHRRPRVLVLATGSELVAPGEPRARGQIPDSNSFLLAAAVTAAGCEAVRLPPVPDDAARLREVLAAHEADVDAVITAGGVSVGAYDVVKEALTGWGDVAFVAVAMQPGKPQGLGRLPGGTPVFCLPGNPVSVFVSFEVLVRPALLRMRGLTAVDRPTVPATVEDGWRTPPGRAQYMPVALRDEGGAWRVRRAVPGGSGSHLAAGLAAADGLAVVPLDTSEVRSGDLLTVMRCEP
ncbi:molybdopterin molybdotransferase MoeA [Actinotalea fermentans]|uniref:Molybdopterin molybdenumtransferase n=1 Tax=Actinotalea fermentans TaxID=43671 RepID=A0A511YUB6_9CELL|nr:gephyrin-like molybdotransferase Glp [Actinotalea fermentans]GEN78784.1 molybdopterin molybdenumtransferase MoeA [Actinotalea fermentans]